MSHRRQWDRKHYYHWEKLRRLTPPEGLSHEEWWLSIKQSRSSLYRELPLTDAQGRHFVYTIPDTVMEMLHKADSQLKGRIGMKEQVTSADNRNRYLVSSLMEEAITSSQLEGAVTTRKDALNMLRSGRRPADKSEWMIVNNYQAMQYIRTIADKPLSPELVCTLHRIVTEHTLDDKSAAGRLQRPSDERVAIWREATNEVIHQPPPAEQLPARMRLMCDFANGALDGEGFIHPIVRSIVLHFWLAYDHPFEDGNGRTARALFYWSMLREGYWLADFISISSLLKKAPFKYALSYLYTETDDNDVTYFLIYQLQIILRCIEELEKFIERKTEEMHAVDQLVHKLDIFNYRQKALLGNAIKNPQAVYTIDSHCRSHGVSYATGRSDLLFLADKGLLRLVQGSGSSPGRFYVEDNIPEKLAHNSRRNGGKASNSFLP